MLLSYEEYTELGGQLDAPGFREKFDRVSENPAVCQMVYDCAVKALNHRKGTNGEDLYLIDGKTGELIYSLTTSKGDKAVTYDAATLAAIAKAHREGRSIAALHNHPNGLPPTLDDGASAKAHGYSSGIVVGHNFEIYRYNPADDVYDNEFCKSVHEKINMASCLDVDFDEELWYDSLNEYGMEVRRILNAGSQWQSV